jgi:hypothetical protein
MLRRLDPGDPPKSLLIRGTLSSEAPFIKGGWGDRAKKSRDSPLFKHSLNRSNSRGRSR